MSGKRSTMEPGRSIIVLVANRVCRLKGTNHRDAEAVMEVGPAGSIQSLGKPSTRGSGGAKSDLS